jgi:hypothetical protein
VRSWRRSALLGYCVWSRDSPVLYWVSIPSTIICWTYGVQDGWDLSAGGISERVKSSPMETYFRFQRCRLGCMVRRTHCMYSLGSLGDATPLSGGLSSYLHHAAGGLSTATRYGAFHYVSSAASERAKNSIAQFFR